MSVPLRGAPVHLEPPGAEPVDLGRFGEFGGRFAPETLVPALGQLEAEFRARLARRRVPRRVRGAALELRRPADAGHRMRAAVGAPRACACC